MHGLLVSTRQSTDFDGAQRPRAGWGARVVATWRADLHLACRAIRAATSWRALAALARRLGLPP